MRDRLTPTGSSPDASSPQHAAPWPGASAAPTAWRRRALLALGALALAACSAPTPPGTAPGALRDEDIHLRVIAFNDFHGHLESGSLTSALADPARPETLWRVATGGAAALAGLAQRLRRDAPHSVLISSGDLIGATPLVSALFRHEPTIEAMNVAGLDLNAAGNHEFDAGVAELLRLRDGGCGPEASPDPIPACGLGRHGGARFPMVAANVRQADGRPLLPTHQVIQAGPVRVGIIGAVTRHTPQLVVPSGVAGLSFTDEAQAINETAERLKARGIQTLIVSLHEGGEVGESGRPVDWNDTRCPGFRGSVAQIVQRLSPDIDLVLTAHTHQGYNCLLDGRHVMQAVSYGRGLSVADLRLDPRTGDVRRERTLARNLPVLNERTEPAHREALAAAEPAAFGTALREARPDPRVQALVERYRQAAEPRARRVVGRLDAGLDRRGPGDSAAGRLVADAQWEATRPSAQGGADFALMNPGGLRSDLVCSGTPPCEVTYGDVFTLQPFGNSLVVMSLTGEEVRELLEQQQRQGPNAPLMSPSASLTYRWQASAPVGRRASDIRVHGRPLEPQAIYRVTVNSFMAEGGDGYTVLQRGRERVGGPQDVDAMLAHLNRGAARAGTPRIRFEP